MGPFSRRLLVLSCATSVTAWLAHDARAADAERASPPAPTCERDSAHGWQGIVVSRDDPETAAAWSNGSLWVTRDDGRTWTRPLHLQRGYVESAIALSDGRFAVLARDPSALVLVRSDGRTNARRMPFEPRSIAGGSSTLALVAEERVATSHDAGRSWRTAWRWRGGDHDYTSIRPIVELDGTLRVLSVDVNTCASVDRLESVRMGVLHRDATHVEPREYDLDRLRGAYTFALGAHGWVYGWSGTQLLAVTRHRALPMRGYEPVLEDAADGYARRLSSGTNGRITLGVVGRDLLRLDGERAVWLASDAPPDVLEVQVDPRGRAWLLDDRGAVTRFSRRDGWTPILPGCAVPAVR